MAADKIYRILSMYRHLAGGGSIDKDEAAERYDVNVRSIYRDLDDIRDFLEKRSLRTGDGNTIVYDRARKVFRLKNRADDKMDKDKALAVCRIVVESGAFPEDEMETVIGKLRSCLMTDEDRAEAGDSLSSGK